MDGGRERKEYKRETQDSNTKDMIREQINKGKKERKCEVREGETRGIETHDTQEDNVTSM